MKDKLSLMVRVINSINTWSSRFLAGFIIVMIAAILTEVVARYFLNRPTIWAMELATMIFGTYMIGGGVWALIRGGHVRMDIFYNRWAPRTKAIVDCCTFPFFVIFFAIVMWKATVYGIESVVNQEHSQTAWGPPVYHWKMTVPLFVGLIILQGLSDFLKKLFFAVTGKEL